MPPAAQNGVTAAVEFIRGKTTIRPRVALILGSGLGDLADTFSDSVALDTRIIPGYPVGTIEGHRGRLVFAACASVPVVAFQGRLHFYESNSVEAVLFPVRVADSLGAKILIATNASGGINPEFQPGDLMVLTDQVNLTGETISEKTVSVNERKPIFDSELVSLIREVSRAKSIPLWGGVYGAVKGPSYETAAEVKMVRRLGGDVVGMSTVLETAMASALGMRVAGISCITNKATGISAERLSHDEVTVAASRAKHDFERLILGVIEEIGRKLPMSHS